MTTDTMLDGTIRTETGSAAARRMRRGGKLPASVVLLGGETVDITLDQHAFDLVLQHHSGESLILSMSVADRGNKHLLLAEVQRDQVTGRTLHADFHEISMSETVQVAVPVELEGDSEGVNQGGILEQVLREVEIECLPGDMIDAIAYDITKLDIGDVVTVADLQVNDKVTILSDSELAVAHVTAPKEEEPEEEAEEGAEGEAAEPEVIGKSEEEEEPEE